MHGMDTSSAAGTAATGGGGSAAGALAGATTTGGGDDHGEVSRVRGRRMQSSAPSNPPRPSYDALPLCIHSMSTLAADKNLVRALANREKAIFELFKRLDGNVNRNIELRDDADAALALLQVLDRCGLLRWIADNATPFILSDGHGEERHSGVASS